MAVFQRQCATSFLLNMQPVANGMEAVWVHIQLIWWQGRMAAVFISIHRMKIVLPLLCSCPDRDMRGSATELILLFHLYITHETYEKHYKHHSRFIVD